MTDNLEDTKPRPAITVTDAPSTPRESHAPDAPQPVQPPIQPQTPPSAQFPVQTPPVQQRPPMPRPPVEPAGPPRWLFWGVILLFLLGMFALIGGLAAFRFVLEPAQQERIMQALPFMEAFLPPRPAPGDTLPTPVGGGDEDISPDDLLSGLNLSGLNTTPAAEETAQPTEEPIAATATLEPTTAPTEAPTAQPTEAPTLAPTEESAVQPTTESVQAISTPDTSIAIPRSVRLTGFNYQAQTWNNCGPANITMALSYYGWQEDQAYAARFLKPGGREDKNVSPQEMVAFVKEQTALEAMVRMGGTVDLIKQLLANNIPVVIESGSMPEGYDWLGHYRTMVGYSDSTFTILDSFVGSDNPGVGIEESFADFDDDWHQFNRTFIVVYEPQRQALVERILGDYMDEQRAAEIALETATAEATANPTDGHAWYNLGTSLVALGQYERAGIAFDRARRAGVPWRMTWYQFGPYEAYYGAGRYEDVISLANASLGSGGEYVEETHYWHGRAMAALGNKNEAASSFRKALNRNPRYTAARDALDSLGI